MPDNPLNDLQQESLRAAAQWYVRLKENNLDEDERRHLRAWLRSGLNIEELAHLYVNETILHRAASKSQSHRPLTNLPYVDFYRLACRSNKIEKPHANQSPPPLSISYLKSFRKRNLWAKVAVATAALCIIVLAVLVDSTLLAPGMACMLCLGAILSKEAILSHRISRGSFGTTESEVRDLIRFIVENCDSDDFTDGKGRRRPALVVSPEESSAKSDHLPIGAQTR